MANSYICAGLAILLFQGCATPPSPRSDLSQAGQWADTQTTSPALKPYYQRLEWEGPDAAQLNRMRLASAAMEQQEWRDAERALDEVISHLESLGPADERSRKALRAFDPEEIKRFKGEPHEQSMAWFLRGLLHLRENSWDNARACFKSVQLCDVSDENPQARADWGSADWLEGWCNFQRGDSSSAGECWKRARDHHPKIPPPSPSPNDHILCVALLGFGPVKVPVGKHGETLDYTPGNSRAAKIRLVKGNHHFPFYLLDDVFQQAKSRGKRVMDAVNQDKADTREGIETAGNVLMTGGVTATTVGIITDDTRTTAAGLGATTLGMVTSAAASGIQPQSDTRTWDLLPATIHLLSIPKQESDNLIFQFLDPNGNVIVTRSVALKNNGESQVIILNHR